MKSCDWEGIMYDIQTNHVMPANESRVSRLPSHNNTGFDFHQIVIVIVCNRNVKQVAYGQMSCIGNICP